MTTHLDPGATIKLLQRILTDVPKLEGPCRGRHELFDARGADEPVATARRRHQQAVDLCRRCPALDACAAFTAGERDFGMVRAGQMPLQPVRGRPKRAG